MVKHQHKEYAYREKTFISYVPFLETTKNISIQVSEERGDFK